MSDPQPLDPQAADTIRRVRRLMLIASGTTFLALAVVLGVIGYRVFHWQGSVTPAVGLSPTLPPGARVVSSAVGDGHIVLTVEVGGALELRTYDLNTLKPLARLPLSGK
jgi:hypothetical protein